jgi:hypothetical protein
LILPASVDTPNSAKMREELFMARRKRRQFTPEFKAEAARLARVGDRSIGQVAFFRGTSLRPMPPGESKGREWRYLDIREGEDLDERQLVKWIKRAAELPGLRP